MKQKAETWFRISKDLKIEELDTPDLSMAEATKYWIRGIYNGRTYTTIANNTYKLYDYKIYNVYIEETVISEMNLTCHSFHDTRDTAFYTYIEFYMTDFYKNERKIINAGGKADSSKEDILSKKYRQIVQAKGARKI